MRFKRSTAWLFMAITTSIFLSCSVPDQTNDTIQNEDSRMEWWREARFGMFIHWGLYAIPAGEWNEQTNHAEWIRTTAEIPLDTYDEFLPQFNPVKFDADEWVRMAKDAGMKYITITSKHHDGFALYDSEVSDYDVMGTPFKRDILKELAEACRKADIKLCFYHSIMDWHHPDYLPRRNWETGRSSEGAEFPRFVDYMKSQLKELLTEYGDIGVLWFDGEWEDTWTHQDGVELYDYVRSFQSDIIINNRVDKGRQGMQGLTAEGDFKGDFGTPEQEIPDIGLPGIDWESCMTMNDHWGYNKNDDNWKSTEDLIQKLSDIASKGGNFLLNIGPKADGTFPQESIDRLKAIGEWMKVNGESIYGTSASPFEHLSWGRVTQKELPNDGTRLYLHVFDWPEDGKLRLSGIRNKEVRSGLMASPSTMLSIERDEDALVISVPKDSPDDIDAVIFLDIEGSPEVILPPQITFEEESFVDEMLVELNHDKSGTIRYTLDESIPTVESNAYADELAIQNSVTLNARLFENGLPLSGTASQQLTKVSMQQGKRLSNLKPGLAYKYYEGDWNQLPEFKKLRTKKRGAVSSFNFSPRLAEEQFAFEYDGYISIPENGAYRFYISSDDGSQLFINDQLLIDNDGLHGMVEKNGLAALSKGYHKIRVTFFEKGGGDGLIVSWKGPSTPKNEVSSKVLFH